MVVLLKRGSPVSSGNLPVACKPGTNCSRAFCEWCDPAEVFDSGLKWFLLENQLLEKSPIISKVHKYQTDDEKIILDFSQKPDILESSNLPRNLLLVR